MYFLRIKQRIGQEQKKKHTADKNKMRNNVCVCSVCEIVD